jgi:hypothetical protein
VRAAVARPLPPPVSVVLAALAAGWSAAVLDQRLLGATLPGPGNVIKVLPYAMPALLLASILFRNDEVSWLDGATASWVVLVLLAVLLIPKIDSGSLTALAIPAVAATAVVARRWPAATLFVVALFSASFGSLQAFWNFPVEKVTALLLGALWIVSLTGRLFRGSRPVRPSLAMGLLFAYVLITAIMVPLASDRSVAELGFKDSAWFMLIVLLIAYAGWGRDTHQRIAQAILVVATLAGIYAIYRVIAGPAVQEFRLMAQTIYNFSGGKLKPGGSFGSAQSMGTWMAAVVPFAFACVLGMRGRWRILAALASALCVVAALESQLRVGLVGIVVGLLLVLVLYQCAHAFPGARIGTTVVAAVLGVSVLAAGLAISGGHPGHSYAALLHPGSDPSVKERQYKWTQALQDLDTHPFGYGVGSASFAEQVAGQTFFLAGDTNVDNGFLRVALEQGLVIMGVFAIALLAVMLALIRGSVRLPDRRDATIAIGAAGTLASFVVVMVAEDATYSLRSVATWLIVGLGMAVILRRRGGSAWGSGRAQRAGDGTMSVAAEAGGSSNS